MTKALTLKISADFALPYEAQTRTFVVYGGKGKGKSNLGAVLCEEFAAAGLKFCVIDPLDVFWGLRHGKTKDEQGIDVVILGGTHGDLPIDPGAGSTAADFVVDEPASVIIVMRRANGEMWTNGERIRFMRDFMTRVFQKQGEARRPLHIVIDEAGRFVPQMPAKNDLAIAECIGAIEQAVEWGRNFGIGVTLITQRSARMNKSVSELAECMIAFQTAGPRSIGAVVDWFGEHIPRERQHELVGILRKLPVGRALVVSPEFLDFEGEAQIRHRRTFDSSATPKAGTKPPKPGKRRTIDLEAYRVKLGETIAKAEAEDPKALTKRIRELEAAVQKRVTVAKDVGDPKAIERAVAALEKTHALAIAQFRKRFETMARKMTAGFAVMQNAAAAASKAAQAFGDAVKQDLEAIVADPIWTGTPRPAGILADDVREGIRRMATAGATVDDVARNARRVVQALPTAADAARGLAAAGKRIRELERNGDENGDRPLGKRHREILNALAELHVLEIRQPSRIQLGAFAGRTLTGGTGGMDLTDLVRAGLVTVPTSGLVQLTEAGHAQADPAAVPQSLGELHDRVRTRISSRHVQILDRLLELYPESISRELLGQAVGRTLTGGTGGMDVTDLVKLGFATVPAKGQLAAAPILFPSYLT